MQNDRPLAERTSSRGDGVTGLATILLMMMTRWALQAVALVARSDQCPRDIPEACQRILTPSACHTS